MIGVSPGAAYGTAKQWLPERFAEAAARVADARDAEVAAWAKAKSRGYDCLVPVSGGKDSLWQVVTCLEAGLNVLAVTWRPPGRTRSTRRPCSVPPQSRTGAGSRRARCPRLGCAYRLGWWC